MSKVTIALLNFNGKAHLSEYLPSVVEHSQEHSIVLIDNGSTDDSVDFVRNHYPEITLICFEENYGFCGGYNRALEIIDSEYVVLLNTDVRVTANWISPVMNYISANPQVKAAQPKILADANKSCFEYAGGAGGFLDSFGYPFCRGRVFETLEQDKGQYDKPLKVSWASGSCLFIHRATFNEVGGLDERFFAHMEEIDLCWRLWNLGLEVAVVPSSTVYHLGGGTLHKSNPRKTYLNFRNGLSLLVKNEVKSALIWKLPIRLILDWVAIAQFSVQSGPQHGLAIIKAHVSFFKEFRTSWSMRPEIFLKQKPELKGLLVYFYFILKKRTFLELKSRIKHIN
jgi:GT2 family glycosyltransferase